MATGRFHMYWPERYLKMFEHLPADSPVGSSLVDDKPNTLLFIPGLFDTFDSVPYVAGIANKLTKESNSTWSVMEIQLTSFGIGFGTSDLNRDVEEICKGVEWLRSRSHIASSKVVLMGHSTGSQDVLHYLYYSSAERAFIDGAILQGPVSDREALKMVIDVAAENENGQRHLQEVYQECVRQAKDLQSDPEGPSLPRSMTSKLGFQHAYLSPSRFLSLTSPDSPDQPSLDDLFSSDLSDQRLNDTFGMVGRKGRLNDIVDSSGSCLLILICGADEHVPSSIEKTSLLERWGSALRKGGTALSPLSEVVDGVKHNGEGVGLGPSRLVNRCLAYLHLVEGHHP